jgi:hypothetical protein
MNPINWKNIILVPDSDRIVRNLLTEYGWLVTTDVWTHVKPYVGTGGCLDQSKYTDVHLLVTSAHGEGKG